jgi:hypothetical protein
MPVPAWSFNAWWRTADMGDAFTYHRRVMLLLQTRRPPNLWFFKAPHHTYYLDAFLAAYPNARFVFTHRDPVKVVPSYVSLVRSILVPGAQETTDPHKLGRFLSEHLRVGLEKAIAVRKRIGNDRFIDVHHREFVADPMGTLERIYKFLGYELTSAVRTTIAAWSEANRSGAHGVHRYTLQEFGLSAEQIRSDYDFYVRHFDVAVEKSA